MADSEKPSERSVKGSVIVDYLKIIRANPDLPWSEHLPPEDIDMINQMVLPASWYPIDIFSRMGMAIFKLVSRESYEIVQAFGRSLADRMNKENPGMVVKGGVIDTLKKFDAIQARLYSIRILEIENAGPARAVIHFYAEPGDQALRLLVESTFGTVERLVELAGGANIRHQTVSAMWEGYDQTQLEVSWEE